MDITTMALNTKQRILLTAEKIMARKGLSATISEIASQSGIKDSVIYHYFKNKEDLLFSIAEERLEDIRQQMEEQLLAIDEPVSRLRKLVFFRIYYMDKHRNYGSLLLFECRSNMNFYHHPAFEQAKWFMILLGKIIESGINAGVFRKDLNIWLVRDAVFGLMDLANMRQLSSSDSTHQEDFEHIIDLILPMVLIHQGAKPDPSDKRKRILMASEKIFAEKGYENATIQDIASLAGVGDGTVYDYFKNKEDLLFNTLKEGFQPSSLKKGFQDHLQDPGEESGNMGPMENLEHFIRRLFLISLTQPAFAKIFILNGIYNKRFYDSDAGKAVTQYMDKLSVIITEGKARNLIRPHVDPDMFGRLVLGAFSHMTLRWLISEKKAILDKVGEINTMVELITRSVSGNICA
ncbi:MAG: TetR/AcrR family transcriptional regulator [Proteobacteria bacterium]|nr:TetR/AcrR family transcriptional regulator [Pseudomonadota bacterium]